MNPNFKKKIKERVSQLAQQTQRSSKIGGNRTKQLATLGSKILKLFLQRETEKEITNQVKVGAKHKKLRGLELIT